MMNKIQWIVFILILVVLLNSCAETPNKVPKTQKKSTAKDTLISDNIQKQKTDSHKSIKLKRYFIRNEDRSKYYGFKDLDGNVIIQPTFKYADRFINKYAVVFNNDKWGLINKEGEYVAEPIYSYISYPKNGFVLMNIDGHWGYLNNNFEIQIKPQYLAASEFSDNKAMVLFNEDSLAIIDTLGNRLDSYCQFPDTLNNNFSNLSKDELNKILHPQESYGFLKKYIEKHFKNNKTIFYHLRKNPSDGEGTYLIGFQESEFGIKLYAILLYEDSEYHLRIPGISFEDAVDLAIQIAGNRLKKQISESGTIKLDMGNEESEHYIEVKKNKMGFIELVEVSSV